MSLQHKQINKWLKQTEDDDAEKRSQAVSSLFFAPMDSVDSALIDTVFKRLEYMSDADPDLKLRESIGDFLMMIRNSDPNEDYSDPV